MDQRGLTLLELLLAVTVLAMISMVSYAAFSSVVEGVESAREEAQTMRERRFLTNYLVTNLQAAYIHPYMVDTQAYEVPYFFEGANEQSADGPADRLVFFSQASARGGQAMPGDIKQVLIEVTGDEEGGDEFDLDRTDEEAEAEQEDEPGRFIEIQEIAVTSGAVAGGDAYEVIDSSGNDVEQTLTDPSEPLKFPIRTFDVLYWDGQQFVEEWYSDEFQRLPWAVQVRINFPKSEEVIREEKDAGIDPDDDPDLMIEIPLMTAGMGIETLPIEVPGGLDPRTIEELQQPGDEQTGDDQTGQDPNPADSDDGTGDGNPSGNVDTGT